MTLYPVLILAGGLATRLQPITHSIPKALVEVAGKPFIEHQLLLLKANGVHDVIILAWYKGEMIRDFVQDGKRYGMDVVYVFDGPKPLGTGGAIRKALTIMNGPFFSLYGDSYLPCDYEAIQSYFDEHQKPALMTIYPNHGQWDDSNVEIVNGKIFAYDKNNPTQRMNYIDYGLGLFQPEVFKPLAEDEPFDLADIYRKLIIEYNLLPYVVHERFYEIGSFEGLQELDALLSNNPNQFLRKD